MVTGSSCELIMKPYGRYMGDMREIYGSTCEFIMKPPSPQRATTWQQELLGFRVRGTCQQHTSQAGYTIGGDISGVIGGRHTVTLALVL